jgi:alternate signal-mediated exported protein
MHTNQTKQIKGEKIMNRTRKRSRRATTAIAVVLSVVIALSATFAWITTTVSRVNHFENHGYLVDDGTIVITETFTPPPEWKIGDITPKEVAVTNTGSAPVLVRVSYEDALKVLGGSPAGEVTYIDDKSIASTTGLIRANTDIAPYSTWTIIAHGDIIVESGLTIDSSTAYTALSSDIVVKKGPTGDAVAAYRQYTDTDGSTKYQSVKIAGSEWNVTTSKLTLTEVPKLAWFTEGTREYDSWTGSRLNTDTSWVGYGITENPIHPIPAFADIGKSQIDANILFSHSTDVVNTLAAANKWYYDATDGYFYYTSILEAGASTPLLLQSIAISGAAGDAFKKVEYDLSVTVSAIQAVEEAVGSTGWNITNTTLKTYLEGLF